MPPTKLAFLGYRKEWERDWVVERASDAVEVLAGPVILPDTHCLTQQQRSLLAEQADNGRGLLWVGRTPDGDWPGHGPCPPPEGETAGSCELKPTRSDHPLLKDVVTPIMLGSAFSEPGIEGEIIAEVDGRPALVVREEGDRREAWLAGSPVYGYVRPGDHGSHRSETGGMALLRNVLEWLSKEGPVATLWPYPPENAYRDLRPWDRRDVPTMEMFPMVGDDCLVCLLFNYLGLDYRTNLVMRLPAKKKAASLMDIYTEEDLLPSAKVDGPTVSLSIEMPKEKEFLAVELKWK